MNRVIRTLLTASLSFVARIMRAYSARVTADGGVVEATACATSTLTSLDSKSLLQSATFVLAPSGYKSGVIYSQVPSNGNGDLTVTRATTATRVNSAGLIESVASGVPQLDYSLGGCPNFLFEPQRKNWVKNNTMVGASSSPSTLPTGWRVPTINNGSCTVVGTGTTSDGYNYVDFRFQTTSSTTNIDVELQFLNSSSDWPSMAYTTSGDQAYLSTYIRLISGSLSNINSVRFYFDWHTSANIYVSTTSGSDLKSQISASNSLIGSAITVPNNGTIAKGNPYLGFNFTVGTAIDFTIRVYAPMVETGASSPIATAYRTSFIPTSGTSATRNATSFTRSNIYTNGLISASGGTWFVELKNNISLTRDIGDLGLMLSTSPNYFSSGSAFTIRNSSAGSSKLNLIIYTPIGNIAFQTGGISSISPKIIFRLNTSTTTVDIFVNGSNVGTYALFSATALEYLNCYGTDVPKYISQMALWNTPLSDAQCIALTS